MHYLFYTYSRSPKIFQKWYSTNDGVRCNSSVALERIIDHLNTAAHNAADNISKMQQKRMTQSDQHPWVKSLKSHNAEKIKLLIELAIDVYNVSWQLTLSAHSWPSRSLSKIHADTQILQR